MEYNKLLQISKYFSLISSNTKGMSYICPRICTICNLFLPKCYFYIDDYYNWSMNLGTE